MLKNIEAHRVQIMNPFPGTDYAGPMWKSGEGLVLYTGFYASCSKDNNHYDKEHYQIFFNGLIFLFKFD